MGAQPSAPTYGPGGVHTGGTMTGQQTWPRIAFAPRDTDGAPWSLSYLGFNDSNQRTDRNLTRFEQMLGNRPVAWPSQSTTRR